MAQYFSFVCKITVTLQKRDRNITDIAICDVFIYHFL